MSRPGRPPRGGRVAGRSRFARIGRSVLKLEGHHAAPRRTAAETRAIKKQGIVWATGGLTLALAVALVLRFLGVSDYPIETWWTAAGLTAVVQSVLWLIPHLGLDRRLARDARYIELPMVVAAGLLGFYVYMVPEGRHLLLMGWFVALLFLTGIAGFVEIVGLGAVMAVFYLAAIWIRHAGGYALDLSLELVQTVVFLAIHVYAGFVFQRIRHQRREMRELREELASQALTDALTGLPNRRYFEEFLDAELDRIDRYGGACSVVMVDVDDFKNYNDTLGHLAGDEILRQLADVFREEVRLSDVVARYGGEEFGIIMINTEAEEALEASERLRHAIESHVFPDEDIQPGGDLTVSAGVAAYPTDGETYERLIREADEALYAAKREGKNRVLAA